MIPLEFVQAFLLVVAGVGTIAAMRKILLPVWSDMMARNSKAVAVDADTTAVQKTSLFEVVQTWSRDHPLNCTAIVNECSEPRDMRMRLMAHLCADNDRLFHVHLASLQSLVSTSDPGRAPNVDWGFAEFKLELHRCVEEAAGALHYWLPLRRVFPVDADAAVIDGTLHHVVMEWLRSAHLLNLSSANVGRCIVTVDLKRAQTAPKDSLAFTWRSKIEAAVLKERTDDLVQFHCNVVDACVTLSMLPDTEHFSPPVLDMGVVYTIDATNARDVDYERRTVHREIEARMQVDAALRIKLLHLLLSKMDVCLCAQTSHLVEDVDQPLHHHPLRRRPWMIVKYFFKRWVHNVSGKSRYKRIRIVIAISRNKDVFSRVRLLCGYNPVLCLPSVYLGDET